MGMAIWLQGEPDYSLGTGLFVDDEELTYGDIMKFYPRIEVPIEHVYDTQVGKSVCFVMKTIGLYNVFAASFAGTDGEEILPKLKEHLDLLLYIEPHNRTDDCIRIINILQSLIFKITPGLTLYTTYWEG